MDLWTLIATNAAGALALIKRYIGMPSVAGVFIEPTRFECTQQAEVSQHVLIDLSQGKHVVNDNVAPGPRSWEVEGFVGGLPVELSVRFMPSIRLARDILDAAMQSRQVTTLRDPMGKEYQVILSRFWYAQDPTVANRLQVQISAEELFTLSTTFQPTTEQLANPSAGSSAGEPLEAGNTEASAQASTDALKAVMAQPSSFTGF